MTIYINQTDADKKEYLEKDTGCLLYTSSERIGQIVQVCLNFSQS